MLCHDVIARNNGKSSSLRETNEIHATAVTIFKRLKLLSNFPLNISKDNQNFIEWKIWRRVQISGMQGNHILDKKLENFGNLILYSPVAVNIKLIVFLLIFCHLDAETVTNKRFYF